MSILRFSDGKPIVPFIKTQRLVVLHSPPHLRKQCLEPTAFRARRRKVHKWQSSEGSYFEFEAFGLPKGCSWTQEPDRVTFLMDPRRKRLCLTIDAGVGKTTAMIQTQYLRVAGLPGHLVMGFRFAELPNEARRYLDDEEDSWLAARFCDLPATRTAETRYAVRLIRQQIRNGQFTMLVDALDQTRNAEDAAGIARALRGFLSRYPEVRCVVSGRPYAIQRYWDDLFENSGPWDFAQIDVFDDDEQREYLGKTVNDKLIRLQVDVISIPRMLETLYGKENLDNLRTAADIYWRTIDDSLKKAFATQSRDLVIRRTEAEKLFAMLAFEMVKTGNFDGVPAQKFSSFVDQLFQNRMAQISGASEYDPRHFRLFIDQLEALGRVNVAIDYAVVDGEGLTQLYFRHRSLQSFFAALWVTRLANADDLKWLRTHQFIRADESTADLEELWRFATEMPADAMPSPNTYVPAMSQLILPSDDPTAIQRSTEMIYRCWPKLLELAGYFTPPESGDWTEHCLDEPIQTAQREARIAVEQGSENTTARTVDASDARDVILSFFGEFHEIRLGLRSLWSIDTTASVRTASVIASEFENNWLVMIPPQDMVSENGPYRFWMGGPLKFDGEFPQRAEIAKRFQIAKYPVTNELYGLFDPQHFGRFRDYLDISPDPRCPAVHVEWFDAWAAALWLGCQLPDEYEWEFACRASIGVASPPTVWCFGDNEKLLGEYAWHGENAKGRTHPVDTLKPNGFGLRHVHGNVWEWTSSHDTFNSEVGRIQGFIGSPRVLRGGSCGQFSFDCRSGSREVGHPLDAGQVDGFRVSRVVI